MGESAEPDKPFLLLLWGDTQVGKTTLLTVAFNGSFENQLAEIGLDVGRSAAQVHQAYGHSWRALSASLPTAATAHTADTPIFMANGRTILLRDIRGGDVRRDHEPTIMDLLYKDAHAGLFLIDPTSPLLDQQFAQLATTLLLFSGRPKGLVFTKCELLFDEYHSVWGCQPDWWRAVPGLARHGALIAPFGQAVWPTSAFGFQNGYPAVILGEFGELLPYRIRPRAVLEPFKWMFRRVQN